MCQLMSVSVLALQSAAVVDLQLSINQLYFWLSDFSCFCRSVSLWIHANCMSVSLFVCFSVCLSVTVCQSACPPNCVSVLSASVLVTQSAVIDLQFYVNQFFFVIKVRFRCTAVVCLIVLYFVVRSLRLSAPSECLSIPYTIMVVACHCHSISLFLLPG